MTRLPTYLVCFAKRLARWSRACPRQCQPFICGHRPSHLRMGGRTKTKRPSCNGLMLGRLPYFHLIRPPSPGILNATCFAFFEHSSSQYCTLARMGQSSIVALWPCLRHRRVGACPPLWPQQVAQFRGSDYGLHRTNLPQKQVVLNACISAGQGNQRMPLSRHCASHEHYRQLLLAVSPQKERAKLFQGAVLFEGNVRSTWG